MPKVNLLPTHELSLIRFYVLRKENSRIQSLNDLDVLNPEPSPRALQEIKHLIDLRAKGIPLQHLLQVQYFLNHEYRVNDSTLIPRPETEVLVQAAIDDLSKIWGDRKFKFAELGVGSGIISCEILARFKNAEGVGTEVASNAIALARENLAHVVGPDFDSRMLIIEPQDASVGFELFQDYGKFDVVFSNPPYVSIKDEIADDVLKHEPHRALFPQVAGETERPNYFYENFLIHAKTFLKPKGIAFFEVPHERALEIAEMFRNAGFRTVDLIPDLTGRNRVLRASFE